MGIQDHPIPTFTIHLYVFCSEKLTGNGRRYQSRKTSQGTQERFLSTQNQRIAKEKSLQQRSR